MNCHGKCCRCTLKVQSRKRPYDFNDEILLPPKKRPFIILENELPKVDPIKKKYSDKELNAWAILINAIDEKSLPDILHTIYNGYFYKKIKNSKDPMKYINKIIDLL